MSIYLGIDPGVNGGIALIDSEVPTKFLRLTTWSMPEADLDLYEIITACYAAAVSTRRSIHACLEKVSSSPQMGVVSAFTFGKGFGRLGYALAAANIPYDLVTPQKWQSELGIPKCGQTESQPDFKERLRQTAQRLHPRYHLWSEPRSLGKQRAISDAILIATYCQRLNK